ncbi:FAD-dependent oxidoreductase [Paraneptunicella aestuarii]|uniref:FAD-dependent oxidoreductase n=1 Tax=Paraneptunicella aestuarii TaxID=2831148 RepID=UPI001E4DB98E|nr:FAD-dependent oxidoreductase [Paraneptunicella aestuarii]UAA37446.1 FAD-dependent oxidoreductase [Paraneptunicella aestuarii]
MYHPYVNPVYEYQRSPDQDKQSATHHPVIIIGAGPCGLSAAMDFATHGIPCVILDDNNTVSVGSRAICFAKRTLEIFDRYGCADRMVDKGITWKQGKVFFKDDLVYKFDLLPEEDHKYPAFINLQQYYVEEYMVDRCKDFPEIDLRWLHKVTHVDSQPDLTTIDVETQDGKYQLTCDYLLVADGANSPIRSQLGLESKGQVFQDRFLIADVHMESDFPNERWFWFDPPFHPNQSVLLHRQADNIWRIDLQLGWDADPEEEKKEENIRPRLQAMLGKDKKFELDWASVYTFQCRKMDDYIHNRVFFIGDAAHQVSPFGARGANGGVQSVENLVWKIRYVMQGNAPYKLISTYNDERQHGAAENILNSTRATDFITPKSHISKVFRDETLELAKKFDFARKLVNSGRLSVPCSYPDSCLNSESCDAFESDMASGVVCKDAPVHVDGNNTWLLNQLGIDFTFMVNIDVPESEQAALKALLQSVVELSPAVNIVMATQTTAPALAELANNSQMILIQDSKNVVSQRYDLSPGSAYLIRPDQVVCARWKAPSLEKVKEALQRALGHFVEE